MLIRKSGAVFAATGNLAAGSGNIQIISSSRSQLPTITRQNRCQHDRKTYATIAGDRIPHEEPARSEKDHVWPRPPKNQLCPTPYQIFAMDAKTAYTKVRFYELVKIYHPDKLHNASASLPHAVKMERYRLIVAAHNILSDPVRRDAYDRFGAGWNGKSELGRDPSFYQGSSHGKPGPFSHSWQRSSDPIWQNATWEDWERFYARRAREAGGESASAAASYGDRHSPIYMQNSYFLLLLALVALVGSSANYTRAKDAGTYFVAQRDIVHDRTAKDLRRVRQEAALGDRDERIQWFVRNREATLGLSASDVDVVRDEKADRLLPNRETCQSEERAGNGG